MKSFLNKAHNFLDKNMSVLLAVTTIAISMMFLGCCQRRWRKRCPLNKRDQLIKELMNNQFIRMKSYRPCSENDVKQWDDELRSVKTFKRTYPTAKGFVCYLDDSETVVYIAICDPSLIHEFMVEKDKHYERDVTISYVARIFGDSLLFNLAEKWKVKRKIYSQMFHFFQYHSLVKQVQTISSQSINCIQSSLLSTQPIHLLNLFEDILSEWALHLFFGEHVDCKDLSQRIKVQYNNARSAIILLQHDKINNCLTPLKETLLEFLQTTLNRIKSDPDYSNKPQNNMTWYLLNSSEIPFTKESLNEICEDIIIFFFAGRDTMAHTLQMLFYYLCQHQQYQTIIHDEINNLKGDYSVQNLASMNFLEAALKETLRLYGPTTTILPKVAMESHTLLNGKITIPEGTIVSLALLELNYDPQYYNHPDTFYPERWFDNKLKAIEKNIFFPFSYGSHKCIADKLVWPIMKIVFITLVQQYQITLQPSSFHLVLVALIQYAPFTQIPFLLTKKSNIQTEQHTF